MGSSTTVVRNNEPWSEAAPFIKEGLQRAEQIYRRGGFRLNPYPGDLVADPTLAQHQAWRGVRELTPQQVGLLGRLATSAARTAGAGVPDYAVRAFREASRPAYGHRLANLMRQNVTEAVMPAINATFGASGMTGSTLHRRALAKGLASGLAQYEAGMLERQAERGLEAARYGAAADLAARQLGVQGAQTAGQLALAMGKPYELLAEMGSQQQKQRQAEIAAKAQSYIQRQAAGMDEVARWLQLTSGLGANFATQTGRSQYNPGPLGILGAGLQLAGLLF